MIIKLTAAQQSALECAGLEQDTEPALCAAWMPSDHELRFELSDAMALLGELIDACNSETESNNGRPDRGALGAYRALSNLHDKVLAACRDANQRNTEGPQYGTQAHAT